VGTNEGFLAWVARREKGGVVELVWTQGTQKVKGREGMDKTSMCKRKSREGIHQLSKFFVIHQLAKFLLSEAVTSLSKRKQKGKDEL
jgi:hypothetical protein